MDKLYHGYSSFFGEIQLTVENMLLVLLLEAIAEARVTLEVFPEGYLIVKELLCLDIVGIWLLIKNYSVFINLIRIRFLY